MHTIFVTLATFFVLIRAACLSQLSLNTMTNFESSTLQLLVGGLNEEFSGTSVAASFQEVKLPSGNVVLGPPKFPVNVIAGSSAPYCESNLGKFNSTCAQSCGSSSSCASYYIFEATNSGTPKLPYWFCYELNTYLNSSDFVNEPFANFAHAYNRISIR